GTLGWGMGAAIGGPPGAPGRKVVATIGDGSLMYAPHALWTAAHYRLPITYVVPNNSSYAILKSGMLSLDLASAKRGIYPGMDLVEPAIDYVGLARSLGVRAERVEKPAGLRDTLAACLAVPGPTLVDVAIDRGFTGRGGPSERERQAGRVNERACPANRRRVDRRSAPDRGRASRLRDSGRPQSGDL